jgi:hypothetical protein
MNLALDKPALIRRVNEEYEELKAPHVAGLCSLEKSTSSVLLMSACIAERSQACAGRVMLLSQKGAKVVKVSKPG